MLEVRDTGNGFMVFDTEAAEPVMLFATRHEADKLIAALQIEEVHPQLRRWSPDIVPGTY